MTPGAKPSHRLSDRLGFRLGLVLSMALLPVGLIAVIQTDRVLTDSLAQADAALAEEVLCAVAPGMRLVRQAQGAASALAASVLPALSQPLGGCSQTRRALAAPGTPIRSAQVVAMDGRVLCPSALSVGGGDDRRAHLHRPTQQSAQGEDTQSEGRQPGKADGPHEASRSGLDLLPGDGPGARAAPGSAPAGDATGERGRGTRHG